MEQNSDTLVIKHLPNILSNEEKEDLLKHFGALEVKCITSKVKKYNLVFARFENGQIAENILHRLHQTNILGTRISVEFAKDKLNSELPQFKELDISGETEDEKYYKKFLEKLNSWHSGLDFRQPIPSHLRYQYPPPDDLTLLNIAKALASVPKFYTQVLHLMNKMNLPCPFGKEILPDIKINLIRSDQVFQEMPKETEIMINQEVEQNESTESEISTDEETGQPRETIPERPKAQKKKHIKVPKFVKPVQAQVKEKRKKTTFEEVFEKVADEKEPKKIKLSYPQQLDLVRKKDGESSKEVSDAGGFGFIHPVTKPQVEVEEKVDVRDEREEERLEKEEIICITKEELAANRLSDKDRSVLSVFKNYAEGAPTCRLYVKNLAKTVSEQDLRFIYSRFLTREFGEDPNLFDIRLMQEGRMKGQAFITLQSVELAQAALKETNGYILKDKPIVVQFARSSTK